MPAADDDEHVRMIPAGSNNAAGSNSGTNATNGRYSLFSAKYKWYTLRFVSGEPFESAPVGSPILRRVLFWLRQIFYRRMVSLAVTLAILAVAGLFLGQRFDKQDFLIDVFLWVGIFF